MRRPSRAVATEIRPILPYLMLPCVVNINLLLVPNEGPVDLKRDWSLPILKNYQLSANAWRLQVHSANVVDNVQVNKVTIFCAMPVVYNGFDTEALAVQALWRNRLVPHREGQAHNPNARLLRGKPPCLG